VKIRGGFIERERFVKIRGGFIEREGFADLEK
jgi:hypothetical protein